jgi:hypothetical protein
MNRRLAPVTRCRPCLSRGCCQCGALYAGDATAIGFTVKRSTGLFPCSFGRVVHQPFPENVGTHPRPFSLETDSSSEFLRFNHCSCLSARAMTCQGFCPLHDTTAARPLIRGFPSPRCVPSSGVHNLSTVCSALQLVSLFHLTAASRTFARSGVWPLHTGFDLIGRSCPLAVRTRFAHRRIGCHDPSPSASRLRSM